MDVKDTLELHVDGDEVVNAVGLSSSQMVMDIPDVRHVGLTPVVDDGGQNQCIVVVPVESMDTGHGEASGSSHMMGLTGVQQAKDSEMPYDPVTQSWFTTKYSKDSLSEQGHKWKQGMWSNEETELLERNIEAYVREHKLCDASEVIFNNSKDNRKNFYRQIAQGLQRPLFAVYRRVIRMYDHKNHVGRYTPEDINKLKELRAKHGNDWAYIGAEMGRSASSVKDKFRLLKDSCNRGKWTADEESILSAAVFSLSGAQPGESVTTGISWSQVAEKVVTRTEKQCRAKWLNYLNWKQTGGSEWSKSDELTLINKIGETGVELESDIDWEEIAKNWKSVRSPQWLRSKWWTIKRQVSGTDMKTLLEHLRMLHQRRKLQEERRIAPAPALALDTQQNPIKNGTLTLQVPINIGTGSGVLDDGSGFQSLILPQSALAQLPSTASLFSGPGMTTVHSDNHIIIQVTNIQGAEGDIIPSDANARQIIITAKKQTGPSLGQDETDMCAEIHQTDAELSTDASAIVHPGDDLHTSNDHMTSSIGQSQVNVGEDHTVSNEAQLIGTDAVLPQQGVHNADLVGVTESEATLVVVNSVPSSDDLSQPTAGTVEDAQLGGGVFTLGGPLPVLQSQGDEHHLMGSPGHLDTLQHQEEEEEEEEVVEVVVEVVDKEVEEEEEVDVEVVDKEDVETEVAKGEVVEKEAMEEEVEAPVEKRPRTRPKRRRRNRHR